MNERKYTIMVVDDDVSIRNSLRKVLETEGYQTVLAANGVEAVDIFCREQNRIDLLLVDLNMPIRNGWVTLNQMLEANPILPVFILTGLSHQSELAEAAGVRALIQKPVDVPELLLLIKKQLIDPADTQPPLSSHQKFPFRHLRTMHYVSRDLWADEHGASNDHWGLNE